MLTLVGDETQDTISLPNGMIVIIDYGDDNFGTYGIETRLSARQRRVRLFDKQKNLITQLIEDNPHKTEIPNEAFEAKDSNVIL